MPMERIRPGADLTTGLAPRERTERPAGAAAQGAFRERLAQAQAGQLNERIERAIAQIEQLGARLAESLSLADLKRYKQAVASLLRDVTHHMVQVRTQMEWDSQAWEHRTLVTIRKVDEELEKLTQLVLSQEQDRLAILERIGEIKGMLLDLRM